MKQALRSFSRWNSQRVRYLTPLFIYTMCRKIGTFYFYKAMKAKLFRIYKKCNKKNKKIAPFFKLK